MSLLPRDLTAKDTEKLLRFYESLSERVARMFRPFDPISREVLHTHLLEADAGKHISLALFRQDATVQGHAFVLFLNREKPVFGIGLHEHLHGQGWGRQMASTVLERADASGLPLVTLTVLKENTRAISLYHKIGFKMRGEATFREQDDSYYLERMLPHDHPR